MRWRSETKVTPAPAFVAPCVPTVAKVAPRHEAWLFELKLDGYRLIAKKDADRVRLYSRRGADFTGRFPRIAKAVRRLKVRSVIIDGEAISYDHLGMPNFDYVHSKQYDHEVSMVAFDLLELDGDDVRKQALIDRKGRLAKLVAKVRDGIEYSEHLAGRDADIYEAACKLGHEGIVAKRRDLPYESGRSKRWLKIKNPNSPAAKRIEDGSF